MSSSAPPGNLAASSGSSRQRPRSLRALLVGVSRGTADPPLPPLPGVAREIAALGQDFQTRGWPIHQLTDAQADRRTVVEALGRVDLAHLACHGLFRPDRPDASGLFLIPGDGRKAQLLSLRDLSRLDLRHLRHITLSACWSADNYILPGRRILSLPEVLTRAGTASVLSHLWPLDDTVAVTLMQRFYHHLRTLPRDEALRRTQLECLREPETADPYFWAGLRLGGEGGRLRW